MMVVERETIQEMLKRMREEIMERLRASVGRGFS